MDLQGKPIGQSYTGTKVTTDPASYKEPRKEGAGAVASDSLAAESTRRGGEFAKNRDAEPLGVSGDKSTLNNENTSGATRLQPARDAKNRQQPGDFGAGTQVGGSSTGHAGATASGSTASSVPANADPAPSYVNPIVTANAGKPKGKNISEGGFDSDPNKNASFTADVGTKKDPGRSAEFNYQNRTTQPPGTDAVPAGGLRQNVEGEQRKGGQPYGVLDTEQDA